MFEEILTYVKTQHIFCWRRRLPTITHHHVWNLDQNIQRWMCQSQVWLACHIFTTALFMIPRFWLLERMVWITKLKLVWCCLLPLSTRPCKWTPKSMFTISRTQSRQQSQPLQRGQQPYQQMPKCSFRMVQPPHQTQCLVVSHQLTQGFHKKLWNNILNGWVKHLDPMMGLVSMIHYCGIQGPTAAAALSPVIVSPWLKVSVRVIEFTQRSWPTVFT